MPKKWLRPCMMPVLTAQWANILKPIRTNVLADCYLNMTNDNDNRVLKAMTLEQLWELFPVELVAHRAEWAGWAEEEIERLYSILAFYNPVITHVGSTAVTGIMAKPIVDILVEVAHDETLDNLETVMESNGYICTGASGRRITFVKGYTPQGYGERVFHIHFRPLGDNDMISFRDYLRNHGDAAKEYVDLKLSLLPEFKNNRDGYTAAKTQFVAGILSNMKYSES